MDEYIDILTESGEPTGDIKLKSVAHEKGFWHASVQVWIINLKREVLLQKRALNKDSYPNLWDISVAGHLSSGDTPKEAAIREIKEEIGLEVKEEELLFLKRIQKSKVPKKGFLDNEFNYLYALKLDFEINDLLLQAEEVAEVELLKIEIFENKLKQTSHIYVPHGDKYYSYIISKLKSI